jgi:hypothetical protein
LSVRNISKSMMIIVGTGKPHLGKRDASYPRASLAKGWGVSYNGMFF